MSFRTRCHCEIDLLNVSSVSHPYSMDVGMTMNVSLLSQFGFEHVANRRAALCRAALCRNLNAGHYFFSGKKNAATDAAYQGGYQNKINTINLSFGR